MMVVVISCISTFLEKAATPTTDVCANPIAGHDATCIGSCSHYHTKEQPTGNQTQVLLPLVCTSMAALVSICVC